MTGPCPCSIIRSTAMANIQNFIHRVFKISDRLLTALIITLFVFSFSVITYSGIKLYRETGDLASSIIDTILYLNDNVNKLYDHKWNKVQEKLILLHEGNACNTSDECLRLLKTMDPSLYDDSHVKNEIYPEVYHYVMMSRTVKTITENQNKKKKKNE